MKKILHKAETRGNANFGWLNSNLTFSFSSYYHPERHNFGMLRVLNDDTVAAGTGFPLHPHDNMEIVSIPLVGALEHKDSMGNVQVIRKGDVQIMSAGTGIKHSEYNHSSVDEVKFLQIWVIPKERNITPRYQQITFNQEERINKWQVVVSPDDDKAVWINQDAYFSLIDLKENNEATYNIKKSGNGIYLFILNGEISAEGETLSTKDGLGISETESISIKSNIDSEILLMEVPMS